MEYQAVVRRIVVAALPRRVEMLLDTPLRSVTWRGCHTSAFDITRRNSVVGRCATEGGVSHRVVASQQ